MKCCANCEWSISPILEEEIMEEQAYKESDSNRPKAGDCCLGIEHNGSFCCKEHIFIKGMEEYENIVLYDDKYLGPGYLIVSKLDGEVVKFIKLSSYGDSGFPIYSIRGYEKNSKDNPNLIYKTISLNVKKDDTLFHAVNSFSKALDGKRIYSINKSLHGNNNLEVTSSVCEVNLVLSKDIFGVKDPTDFIDVILGDNDSCQHYDAISNFYKQISKISRKQTTQDDIMQLLLTK